MQKIKKIFDERFEQGNRYNLVLKFAGWCALNQIPIEVALDFYNQYKNRDDEDRTHLIQSAYDRVLSGQKVCYFKVKDDGCYSLQEDVDLQETSLFLKISQVSNLFNKSVNKQTIFNQEDLGVPLFQCKDTFPKAYEYCYIQRKLSNKYLKQYNVLVGIGELQDYIVFPIYNKDNEIIFYSARRYLGEGKKYKMPDKNRDGIIWNYPYDFINYPEYILTEGIINAIYIQQCLGFFNIFVDVIAVLSKKVLSTQIDLLKQLTTITLAFDGDVKDKDLKYLFKKVPNIKYQMEFDKDRDANDLTPIEVYNLYKTKKEITKWII